ncbi:Rkm5p [Sugiyamaella lignohabitans]|uniref:Ribosomal lysine N-methyltransferase 5 n=1 Tax=Sugiyamaella lignohabitans TaxID=796027 RepID=A0A167BYU8_9ASCO|nr:Rkm5p [Sugiyamaella lignohabitans]ANB10995.1 Rkm5p [Sugiyamaella lignohabitans]
MLTQDLEPVDEDSLYDHVYELIVSRAGSSQSELGLGYVSRTDLVEISVGDQELEIKQSLSMLNSSQESSTTGAVIWKVSPLFADWLLTETSLFNKTIVNSSQTVVELGTGVAGIVAATLGQKVGRYIATDQEHILKLLSYNIENNTASSKISSKKRVKAAAVPSQISVCEYDWEHLETFGNFKDGIEGLGSNGTIIACDTIYNDYLIPHFVNALLTVAKTMGPEHNIIIAQQLRTHEILEASLSQLLEAGFNVWSVPDELLSKKLRNGFAVHYLQLPLEDKSF